MPGCRHPVAGGAGGGLHVPVGGRGQELKTFELWASVGARVLGLGEKGESLAGLEGRQTVLASLQILRTRNSKKKTTLTPEFSGRNKKIASLRS